MCPQRGLSKTVERSWPFPPGAMETVLGYPWGLSSGRWRLLVLEDAENQSDTVKRRTPLAE